MSISKRYIIILSFIFVVLSIPFMAMQFTSEVDWSLYDFVVVGCLLLVFGLLIEIAIRKVKSVNKKAFAIIALSIVFLLIWIELAVGIFGSPFAGS